jgi:hypothetical protein
MDAQIPVILSVLLPLTQVSSRLTTGRLIGQYSGVTDIYVTLTI